MVDLDQTGLSRLFRSLKAVRRRKGKIGALFLLGMFALMVIGSLSVPASGNQINLNFPMLDPVKSFTPAAPTQVVFTASGTGDSGIDTTITPSYPASPTAGDLFLCVIVLNYPEPATVNSVTDFTLLFGPYYLDDSERGWVYYKYSDGTETGTVTVTKSFGTHGIGAKIFSFSNVHQTIGSAYEDLSYTNLGSEDLIPDNSVTTSGDLSLAVNVVWSGDDSNNPNSFTGETGGDWNQVENEFEWSDGSDGMLEVQTATMATSGTVNGGDHDWGQADPAGVLGFALVPEEGGIPYSKDLTETVTAADVQTNTVDYDRTYTESVSSVDVITTAADFVRNLVETISVVGIISIGKVTTKNMTETISSSDVRTLSVDYVRDWVETVTASDVFSKTFGLNRSESISASDVLTNAVAYARDFVEAITAADTIEASKAIMKNMIETISASDVRTTAVEYVRNQTESISAIDAQSNAAAYVRDFVEAITAADVQTNAVGFARDLVEAITVVEIIDAHIVGGPIVKNLTESINVYPRPTTEGGILVAASLLWNLFFSLEMWGYLGPIALVIGGYFVSQKDIYLGIIWFIVECLIVAQYLLLVTATPDYWWHIFLLLIGGMLTCVYPLWGKR